MGNAVGRGETAGQSWKYTLNIIILSGVPVGGNMYIDTVLHIQQAASH